MSSGAIASPSASSPDPSGPAVGVDRRTVLGILTPEGAVMGGVLLVAFVGVFYRWFLQQHSFSSKQIEDWGHAYMIPLISGYMIWQRRAEIAKVSACVFWPGLVPLVLGIVTNLFFTVFFPNHMLAGGAMVLAIFGAVLTVLGPALMRLLFLPIAYLSFMVTISEAIMIGMTFKLQLIASQGAFVVLSVLGAVFGFTADIDGNTIEVVSAAGAVHPMNVAEACSGMRMVVAFVALAAAVALLGTRHWWQRVALLLLAVPVAVLMNIVRVAVLGVLSLFDENLTSGDAHTFIGTLLLIPSLGLFMLVVWALNRAVGADKPGAGVSS